MAFGRVGMRLRANRPQGLAFPDTIIDLQALPLPDGTVELVFTELAPFHQYRQDGGAATALPGNNIITGLAFETAYTFEVQAGNLVDGPWTAWSNVAGVTTVDEPDTGIGTISDWATAPLSTSALQGSFTPPINASRYQARHALSSGGLAGASIFTLAISQQLTGLAEDTQYFSQARGTDADLLNPGAWSNEATGTTLAEEEESGTFTNPVQYLTAGQLAGLTAEYGITTLPFTRAWGVSGEPNVAYRQPTYDTSGAGIPANALDISAYSGNVANWLADMEVQQKPGKAGSGTYSANGLVTIGTQSIYGYGVTRPIFTGDWKHYIQADEKRFQYLKRTGSGSILWLIAQDGNTTLTTGSRTGNSFLKGAAAQYKRQADHTGLYIIDCVFEDINCPFTAHFGTFRIKKVHVGRNTYRNCMTAVGILARDFGDGNLAGVNGIYFYGNDVEGARHTSQLNNNSYCGTIFGCFGVEFAVPRTGNGPTYIENNHVEDVLALNVPTRDFNAAVGVHVTESDLQFVRYNEFIDIYSPFHTVDCQAIYAKGSVFIEENAIIRCGSQFGWITDNPFGFPGVQDLNGWNTGDTSGSEGSACTLKGGGGWPTPSTIKRNVIVPRFTDTALLMAGHRMDIEGNAIFDWNWSGSSPSNQNIIRSSSNSTPMAIGPNYFVNCGRHYGHRSDCYLAQQIGGGGLGQILQVANLIADFDGGVTDCFRGAQSITNSENQAGSPLTEKSTYAPVNHGRPTAVDSGSVFTINSQGSWNLGPSNIYTEGSVPQTIKWFRDGVAIGGQTASTLNKATHHTGTVEAAVVGTISGKTTTALVFPPFHKLVSELVPGAPATFSDGSVSTSVTQDYALGELTAGEWYRLLFRQTADSSGFLTVTVRGGDREAPLHINSRGRTFCYEFQARAGEDTIRFVTTNTYQATVDSISCGKIIGVPVLGQSH